MYSRGNMFYELLLFMVVTVGAEEWDTMFGDNVLVRPNETHLIGIPRFIQHPPEWVYFVKGANFTCVAERTNHIKVACISEYLRFQDVNIRTDFSKSRNTTRYTAVANIPTKLFINYFGTVFDCLCEAWNYIPDVKEYRKVYSSKVVIRQAYLKNNFRTSDTTNASIGGETTLRCIPPDGQPIPTISWFKSGVQIHRTMRRRIETIGTETLLILTELTESDAGDYFCVAKNIAVTRWSRVIKVNVWPRKWIYVWTQWSKCSNSCHQSRKRICKGRSGADVKNLLASTVTCKKLYESENRNCTFANCKRDLIGTAGSQIGASSFVFYGVLSLFVCATLLVVVVSGILLRRRRRKLHILSTASTALHYNEKPCFEFIEHRASPVIPTKLSLMEISENFTNKSHMLRNSEVPPKGVQQDSGMAQQDYVQHSTAGLYSMVQQDYRRISALYAESSVFDNLNSRVLFQHC